MSAVTAPVLSHLQWRATEWLLAFGPLRPEIVMDYFVLSPFFDRTSNNATLRMQMQFSRGGMEGVDEEAELKRFVGTEYALVYSAPPSLFIIHKRDRVSSTEANTTAVYYILNDNIYQGPSLYNVINERILTSLHALSSSLDLLRKSRPSWSPETLYTWDVRPPPASSAEPGSSDPLVAVEERKRPAEERMDVDAEGPVVVDEETLRPSEAFNPLLFRALQSVASTLPQPPAAVAAPPPAPVKETEVKVEEPEKENTGAAEGVRLSATGKRKPKKAV